VFPLGHLVVFRFLQFLALGRNLPARLFVEAPKRRLPRMIMMHWPMDLLAALLTLRL
jgi:hypothetical protein